MKISTSKTLVALAALASISAFAQTAAPAASSVTIYGRLDLAFASVNDGQAVSSNKVNDYSSRLGFKGERAFANGLTGMFQIETAAAVDSQDATKALASRNSFVGLKSATMGSALIGTYDMPLKSLDSTTGQLWAEADAMETIIHGRGTATTSVIASGSNTSVSSNFATSNVHTRRANVIQYWSPKFADITVKLAYSPDEKPSQTGTTAPIVPSYAKPMIGASALYDNGMWNLGLAYQSEDNATAPTATTSGYALTATKLVAGMKMGDLTTGFAYSVIDNNNSIATKGRKTDNYMVSVAYAMGPVTLKGNYGVSSETQSNAKDGLTMTAVEADYSLDKQTTVYGFYSLLNNDTNAKAGFTQPSDAYKAGSAGAQVSALGVGIRYNF